MLSMKTKIEDIEFKEYSDFLKVNSATFYQSSNHLKFLAKILDINPIFITTRKNDELKGVLPLFVKDSKFGKVVNSLPFFGSYGGIITQSEQVSKEILDFLNNFNEKNDVLSSVIIANPFMKNKKIYEKFYKYNLKEERLAQALNLKQDEKSLWDSLEQRVRRAIRKAQKNSVEIKIPEIGNELLDNFYKMHTSNMEPKNGISKPKDFFKNLRDFFVQGKDYDIFVAVHQSNPIAYLLVFYFQNFTEYYMPSYQIENSELQGTSLLIWESIKKSIEKQASFYNFGGTHKNQRSLYLFKRGWTASDFFYNYYIYGNESKLKEIGVKDLKNEFKYFYVYNYQKIEERQ